MRSQRKILDYGKQLPLLPDYDIAYKESEFEKFVIGLLLEHKLEDNHVLYLLTLESGMLPVHMRKILKKAINCGILPKQKINVSYNAWDKKPSVKIIYPC